MAKLHEALAVESDIKNQHNKIHEETLGVLGKPDFFRARIKRLTMTKPGLDPATKDAIETAGSSEEAIGTTVDKRLGYHSGFFKRLVNHRFQKDLTNQKARSDIIIDGMVVAEAVPATALLAFEDALVEQRKIYAAVPTLDVKKEWEHAVQIGQGVWKTKNPETVAKTEKSFDFKILDKATDKHPAQIEKWTTDVTVGKIETNEYSGMWTSAKKAEVLARCDKLIAAVKEARARANQTEVEQGYDIGSKLLGFIEASEVKVG